MCEYTSLTSFPRSIEGHCVVWMNQLASRRSPRHFHHRYAMLYLRDQS
jgi:hypothetical protein